MIFSQQSPKMLKMASESFIHALLLFSGLFLKISRCMGAPAYINTQKTKALLVTVKCIGRGIDKDKGINFLA